MALFDKLSKFKDELEKATGVDLDGDGSTGSRKCTACGAQLDGDAKFCESCGAPVSAAPVAPVAPVAPAPAVSYTPDGSYVPVVRHEYLNHDAALNAKFEAVFAESFKGLTVKKNVLPADIGVQTALVCRPYDYALFRGDKLVLVIVLTPKNKDSNQAWKNAKAAVFKKCEFMNFYTNMANEKSYIAQRIQAAV